MGWGKKNGFAEKRIHFYLGLNDLRLDSVTHKASQGE